MQRFGAPLRLPSCWAPVAPRRKRLPTPPLPTLLLPTPPLRPKLRATLLLLLAMRPLMPLLRPILLLNRPRNRLLLRSKRLLQLA